VGTIPISELGAKHRLLADSDLICEAINGAHGDQPGSPGGESESNIVVEIDKRPISGKSTPLWVVNLSCEIMLRKKIVRDELIIFCNGPVPKNDSEKLISTIRALREEVALLNSRIRAVEEENKRLGSKRRLGVVIRETITRGINGQFPCAYRQIQDKYFAVDLDDGSYWTNISSAWPFIAPQVAFLFVPRTSSIACMNRWIQSQIGTAPEMDCVLASSALDGIPDCRTVTILPVSTSSGSSPQTTIGKNFEDCAYEAINNDHIRHVYVAAEFGYHPHPGQNKITIINGPYSVPPGFERFFNVLPNTGSGLFEETAAQITHEPASIIHR